MDEMYGFDSKGLESMMMIPEEYINDEYDYNSKSNLMNNDQYHDDDQRIPTMEELGVMTQCSAVSHESVSVNLHNQRDIEEDDDDEEEEEDLRVMKAKIASHPSYPKLLQAYIDCHKVGAPQEMVCMLDEICRREKEEEDDDDAAAAAPLSTGGSPTLIDPQLDHFMESYCHILVKFKSDLSRSFDEATSFLTQIQTQLLNLSNDDFPASSDEELIEIQDAETKREDRQLKEKLLRKYGSHISSLKLEFSKKKKKGKLPKEGRQTLLNWWNLHSKWPYPTEAEKIALAEMTGLDQKQINNWFINQRKRHWKSPDNMHLDGFGVADNLTPNFLHH